MKCKFIVDVEAGPTAPDEACHMENGRRLILAGTVLEGPETYKLVHGGYAVPADDECEEAAKQQPANTAGKLRDVHRRIMQEQADFIDERTAEEDEDDDE